MGEKPRAADVLFGGAAPKPADDWRERWMDDVVRDAFERSGGSISMGGIVFTRGKPKPVSRADTFYGKK